MTTQWHSFLGHQKLHPVGSLPTLSSASFSSPFETEERRKILTCIVQRAKLLLSIRLVPYKDPRIVNDQQVANNGDGHLQAGEETTPLLHATMLSDKWNNEDITRSTDSRTKALPASMMY
jgi:hypothetical protein